MAWKGDMEMLVRKWISITEYRPLGNALFQVRFQRSRGPEAWYSRLGISGVIAVDLIGMLGSCGENDFQVLGMGNFRVRGFRVVVEQHLETNGLKDVQARYDIQVFRQPGPKDASGLSVVRGW